MLKNIALYGGSFDPPHKSHINLIKHLQKQTFVDEVWLLPCGDRTDKKLLLSKQTRFNLMNKIFANSSGIKVVDYQIEMCKKLGRMVQTYQLLKELSRRFQSYKFHFVVGADLLKDLQGWGNGKQLKQQFDFIIFNRKGYTITENLLPPKNHMCFDELDQMSSSSLKKILLDQTIPKDTKLNLVHQFLVQQVVQCLKKENIL